METDKQLQKLLEEGKKIWPILHKMPMYKNKTEQDYLNYIKSTYYYYQSLSEDEKKEFRKLRKNTLKELIL